MNRILSYCIAAAAIVAAPSAASAAVLVNSTNIATQSNVPTSLMFSAGTSSTLISIAGYNLPSFIHLNDIQLQLNGAGANLLGTAWAFAPGASNCTDASQGGVGAYGTNNISLGDVCVGDYDTFSQTISTSIGSSYTLSYLLSNSSSPNGLRITAEGAVAGVPEPATWAMMLLGFASIGLFLRRERQAAAFAA